MLKERSGDRYCLFNHLQLVIQFVSRLLRRNIFHFSETLSCCYLFHINCVLFSCRALCMAIRVFLWRFCTKRRENGPGRCTENWDRLYKTLQVRRNESSGEKENSRIDVDNKFIKKWNVSVEKIVCASS